MSLLFVLTCYLIMFSRLLSFLGLKKKSVNVLVVGLDNSGKTSILNHLKNDQSVDSVVPTVGLNIEKLSLKHVSVTAFDMSGQGRYRSLWEKYYKGVDGIIFVVDSTDTLRMVVAKDELDTMLKHPDLTDNIPILFFANKIDLEDSMSGTKISQILALDQLRNPCHIQSSNALTGEGLQAGIQWLEEQIIQRQSNNRK